MLPCCGTFSSLERAFFPLPLFHPVRRPFCFCFFKVDPFPPSPSGALFGSWVVWLVFSWGSVVGRLFNLGAFPFFPFRDPARVYFLQRVQNLGGSRFRYVVTGWTAAVLAELVSRVKARLADTDFLAAASSRKSAWSRGASGTLLSKLSNSEDLLVVVLPAKHIAILNPKGQNALPPH